MSKRLKITALLMTCLYAVILLHNAVPHLHFGHADKEHDHHHSGETSHHDHPVPGEDGGLWLTAFHSLQHGLAHFDLGTNHLNTYTSAKATIKYAPATPAIIPEASPPVPQLLAEGRHCVFYRTFYVPPAYHSADQLRGPPVNA